jgi:hypothetical protein
MRGTQTYTITRPNGNSFLAKWDDSIPQPLYIDFNINARIAGSTFSPTLLAQQLAAALTYKLGQVATVGDVIGAMLSIAPNGYLTSVGVSLDGVTFLDVVSPTNLQHYFTVSAADISITT